MSNIFILIVVLWTTLTGSIQDRCNDASALHLLGFTQSTISLTTGIIQQDVRCAQLLSAQKG